MLALPPSDHLFLASNSRLAATPPDHRVLRADLALPGRVRERPPRPVVRRQWPATHPDRRPGLQGGARPDPAPSLSDPELGPNDPAVEEGD